MVLRFGQELRVGAARQGLGSAHDQSDHGGQYIELGGPMQAEGKEAGADPSEQVDLAFQLALGRKPDSKEREQSAAFLRSGDQALADFAQVMLNLNEFAYIP